MNYIRHLNAFFSFVRNDKRLACSHVSLYLAIFQYWNYNRFQNPFPVYRENLMNLSKIGSKNTYHKCIKELHATGYIIHHPQASKFLPVKISVLRLDLKPGQQTNYKQLDLFHKNPGTDIGTDTVPHLTDASPNSGTEPVPKMGHNIKPNFKEKTVFKTHTNFLKSNPAENQNPAAGVSKMGHQPTAAELPGASAQGQQNPTLHQVEQFFKESNYPAAEATKFYYYNHGRGWMINKTLPVKNWQSLAHKWMLNPGKYTTPPPAEDPYKDLQYLYERYKEGENIFRHITTDHFDKLGLHLTDDIMAIARLERINQLSGSNQNSILKILKAYLEKDQKLISSDENNLTLLAKKIAVVRFIHAKKESD